MHAARERLVRQLAQRPAAQGPVRHEHVDQGRRHAEKREIVDLVEQRVDTFHEHLVGPGERDRISRLEYRAGGGFDERLATADALDEHPHAGQQIAHGPPGHPGVGADFVRADLDVPVRGEDVGVQADHAGAQPALVVGACLGEVDAD